VGSFEEGTVGQCLTRPKPHVIIIFLSYLDSFQALLIQISAA